MNNVLFHGHGGLYEVLRAQSEKMQSAINGTAAERINLAVGDELIEHFPSEYLIESLVLLTDRAEAEHRETKVDVSHDLVSSDCEHKA